MSHYDYDSCDNSCDSSSSDSCDDYYKKKCHRRKKRYCPPPKCEKPCFGAKLAAKLCPGKVVPASSSCAFGHASFCLDKSCKRVRWCISVYDVTSDEKHLVAGAHYAAPGATNDSSNLVKEFCLKRYKWYPRGYDYDCACKYMFVGKGCWDCEDKENPLDSASAELLACGLLNLQFPDVSPAPEVRGQICAYDDTSC